MQPVTWVDGWPMVVVDGKAVTMYKKPNVGKAFLIKNLPTSDEFNETKLGMQWGWNHNPDSTKWSFTKRHGYLRLMTTTVISDFRMARNTLTQRPFAKRDQTIPTIASTKMDVSKMEDGDIAGLAVFQDPYAYFAVEQQKGKKYILMVNNDKIIDSVTINASTIYLRTLASNATDKASFEYSTDNKKYKPIGEDLIMQFNLKIFTGNRFCLFDYATKQECGYVDFDWFRVD